MQEPAVTLVTLKEIGMSQKFRKLLPDNRQTALPFPEQFVSCPENPFLLYLPDQILPVIYFQMHLSHMCLSVRPSTEESELLEITRC